MSKKFTFLLIFITCLAWQTVMAQENKSFSFDRFKLEDGWENILPVKSNRIEVEKKLGKPTEETGYSSLYRLENVTISFRFTEAPCSGIGLGEYNLPKSTVYSYWVSLRMDYLLLPDLNWDASRYEKFVDKERETNKNTFLTDYSNSRDYISFGTFTHEGKEHVGNIYYNFPGKKYKHLRCESP